MSQPVPWPRELADLPYAGVLTAHAGALRPGADYDAIRFGPEALEDADASGARFIECAFTGTCMHDCRLRRARFSGSWLRDVRVTLTDLAETQWAETTLVGGTLAGVQAFSARLDRVVFDGCKLDSVNFREARLTAVTFRDCLLRDADFGRASLTRTAFTGCEMVRADLRQVRLDQVDLRGSELGIIVGPDSLRGAIVSSAQLAAITPALAQALGITVDDAAP